MSPAHLGVAAVEDIVDRTSDLEAVVEGRSVCDALQRNVLAPADYVLA